MRLAITEAVPALTAAPSAWAAPRLVYARSLFYLSGVAQDSEVLWIADADHWGVRRIAEVWNYTSPGGRRGLST